METGFAATEPPSTPTASRWEDFVDIFISPGELFRRRADDTWMVPLIAVSLLSVVFYYGFPSVQRAFTDAQMAQMIQKRPELAEAMQGREPGPVQYVLGGVIMPIAMMIGIALSAFFTWLAAKITSVDVTWRKALMINAWIAIIGALSILAINIAALLKVNRGEALHPWTDRSMGLTRFMNPDETNGAVLALLSRIDPFAIWGLVLMAIALMVAANAPAPRAWATAAIVWILMALPFLIPAALA